MKKRTKSRCLRCLSAFFILHSSLFIGTAATIDLSGRWELQLDPRDQGIAEHWWSSPSKDALFDDTIRLPDTTSQARIGNPLSLKPVLPKCPPEHFNPQKGLMFDRDQSALTNSSLAHLYQQFAYIGPAWYRRSVEIPKSLAGRDMELMLERVIWQSQVWVNSQFMGTRNSLTTPHRYEIGAALKPGRNEIVIRVDNRRQLAIGDPHAYTEQSQTIWNGVIGRIVLSAEDKVRISRLEVRPDLARQGAEVTVQTHNDSGREAALDLSLQAEPENFNGQALPLLKSVISLVPGDGKQTIFYPMGTNFEKWSEFNPKLYRMTASVGQVSRRSPTSQNQFRDSRDACPTTSATFGMCEFKAADRQFTINGQRTFLRGTVNCCEFPKTGYPDMTGKQWEKIFSTMKAFGLNHMRFHTWCPPEIAFEAADRYGIYLEVELPDWCFKIGQDTNVTEFFRAEGERMIREYGTHPSWLMLTMGNELKGDYSVLDDLENHFRQLDPELLYDSATYPRDKVPEPEDDYYISQDTKCGRARGQDIFNDTPPNTETNFAQAVSCISVPFVSHEVGQYCVYPNLAEIPKYNGVLRALNFEAIRADLKSKGRLGEAPIYTRDSGKLAALLYKEEIERALRTTNQAGFQLLQLNDFPGQGTSTVGLLDAFWDSKNLITPREFRNFCAPVVPLLLMPKRIYQNDETFDAGIEIANFGPGPITNATVVWKISDGKREIGCGAFNASLIPLGNGIQIGRIAQRLASVAKPAKLDVTVRVGQASRLSPSFQKRFRDRHDARPTVENDWSIWVYPKSEIVKTNSGEIFQSADGAFYAALRTGKRVLLLPSRETVKSPLAAEFVPIFWNPVMFPNQPGSMGAMIDAGAPVFAEFPTDPWINWQWWELLHDSFAVNLDLARAKVDMPVRFVDKFDRNALPAAIFEAKVGDGRLLVCTLDISHDLDHRIAARQLRRSILSYMAGDGFRPRCQLSWSDLHSLFE